MINKEILKSITILYVEDEKDIREFTSRILENLTKKVYLASNGEEGLETFLNNYNEIDLIITDINMPKLNGLGMCEKIRKHNKTVPIVITSAHNDPNFLKRSIEIGVNAYAMKPIDLYQLIDSITKAIEPIILQKKLDSLNSNFEEKIEKEVSKLRSILDAQANIVVVTKDRKLINANKKFSEFFDIDSIEKYKENNVDIFSLFDENYGYIKRTKIDEEEDWFSYIHNLAEIDRVVKMKSLTDEERIFAVNLNKYENNSNYFVFSLTDITKIKERTNLLEYQASHDRLTGLYNRTKFDEIYPKEFRRDKRYRNDLSVILFDIDDFKIINDTHGHHIGDDVLRELATLLLKNIREHDIAVRWGGEEFLILLPQTDLNGTFVVAEKIKNVVEDNLFTRKKLKITCSFGISIINENDTDNEMIKKADKALYKAKREGKNRVIICED